jgi:ABC-type bacteriocin/lantibiotic exporter with double-glycine peptidase domain
MSQEKNADFKAFWRILKGERQEVRAIYLFAFFQGLVGLSLPLGIQTIINFLQAGTFSTSWYVLVFFVLLGILFAGILQIKQLTITETIEQRIFANVSFNYADYLPKISVQSGNGKYLPEVLNRFFEVSTIQKGISKILLDFSASIIQVVFGILLLSLYNILFAVIGLLLVVVVYFIFKITGPAGLKTSKEESKYKFEVGHWLQEVSRVMLTFKLSGNSTLPVTRTDGLTSKYLDARTEHFRILMSQYKALIIFKALLTGSLLTIGGVLVISKEINIGQFVAAEIVVLSIMASVEKIILNMGTVYDVLTSIDKIESIADIKAERSDGVDFPNDTPKAGISVSLKNFTLRYADRKSPLLNEVNLQLESGEVACIQGPDGSGKTTLLKAIAGFYEEFEGSISYNNIPIGSLRLESIRSMMGENFTEQEIFKGTLSENITCGCNVLTITEQYKLLEELGMKSFIENLPKGIETVLEPGGQGMPGSLRRKLILARCLAVKPKLLLIEDVMHGQSSQEKKAFFDIVFKYRKGATTIIVSNDANVIERCDKKFKLNNGLITEI